MTYRLLALATLVGGAPLSAQFEGVINVRVAAENETIDAVMSIKGDKMAYVMKIPASGGPMAGMDIRVIADQASGEAVALVPMPPGMPAMGNAKGMKMAMNTKEIAEDASGGDGEIKKLGTSQTIAGMKCDDWELTQKNEPTVRLCLTDGLGRLTLFDMGARGRTPAMPKWARTIYKERLFPLKVWTTDKQASFEVTSIERRAVPASTFVIPSDYMDMSGMMGGMGRRP